MKLAIFVVITTAATVGALAMPASHSWVQPLDAPPEALIIGGSLLLVAAVLRNRLHAK